MKLNEIKVGETYALGKWGNKVTVVGIHDGSVNGQLPEGFKFFEKYSWRGSEYTNRKVVLVEYDNKRKECAFPQEIKSTWSVFEANKAAETVEKEERYAREEKAQQDRKVRWTKLAPALEAVGIDVWLGTECGSVTIEVTAEQLEKLLG